MQNGEQLTIRASDAPAGMELAAAAGLTKEGVEGGSSSSASFFATPAGGGGVGVHISDAINGLKLHKLHILFEKAPPNELHIMARAKTTESLAENEGWHEIFALSGT